MSVQVRRRREAAAFLSTFVGAQGELLVDTTNNRVQVHDGATPGGWPAAKLADIANRTAVTGTYNALTSDRVIAFKTLSASRVVNLPAAAAYPTGLALTVVDETGNCSTSVTITLDAAGSDLINGQGTAVLSLPFGFMAVESDGVSKWTIVDQSTASLAQQPAGAVAITGGTIDGTAVGSTTPGTGGFTTMALSSALGTAGSINKITLFSTTPTGFGFGVSSGSLDYVSNGSHSFYYRASLVGQVTATGLNAMAIGATTAAAVRGTTVAATASVNLPSYTVAGLPAAGTAGRAVFCANARMVTSTGALEASGAGSGGLVTDNGAAWKVAGTNITAVA